MGPRAGLAVVVRSSISCVPDGVQDALERKVVRVSTPRTAAHIDYKQQHVRETSSEPRGTVMS